VLGVPSAPGAVGGALLAGGLVVALAVLVVAWRTGRLPAPPVWALVWSLFVLTLGLAPFLAWRVVEDVRVTSGLDAYERREAGPIQAFLQPYLLDGAARVIPAGATYATATGDAIPYPAARKAFPALAQRALFPRRSLSDPAGADWLVAWGVEPGRVVPDARVVFTRPASGVYPPLYVARIGS
jgi:hypothetical protein